MKYTLPNTDPSMVPLYQEQIDALDIEIAALPRFSWFKRRRLTRYRNALEYMAESLESGIEGTAP